MTSKTKCSGIKSNGSECKIFYDLVDGRCKFHPLEKTTCKGITADDKPCKKFLGLDDGYCGFHRGQNPKNHRRIEKVEFQEFHQEQKPKEIEILQNDMVILLAKMKQLETRLGLNV